MNCIIFDPKSCYPIELFKENDRILLEDFLCPIGLGIVNNSKIDNHGHIFCELCINTWINFKSICPLSCKKTITLSEGPISLNNFINSRKIYCLYKKNGCNWENELQYLLEHLDSDCFFNFANISNIFNNYKVLFDKTEIFFNNQKIESFKKNHEIFHKNFPIFKCFSLYFFKAEPLYSRIFLLDIAIRNNVNNSKNISLQDFLVYKTNLDKFDKLINDYQKIDFREFNRKIYDELIIKFKENAKLAEIIMYFIDKILEENWEEAFMIYIKIRNIKLKNGSVI